MTPEMSKPSIDDAGGVPVDVAKLIISKALVSANSGGGKSRMLRRIAEQTYGKAQHLIFDPEGDFHTLREHYDYVWFGPNGDYPVDVESAGQLMTRLLELGENAIIDLSELQVTDKVDLRAEYIKRALESLMKAPKDLHHALLVFLDEIHLWAPEVGSARTSVALAAVIDFFTRGRKKNFGGIAATQRLAALHNSVIAECNNRLIGRTALLADQTRAARELGMPPKPSTFETLKNLEPGEFFVYGPALVKNVTRVWSGNVVTTHPDPGHAMLPPTPPRAQVKRALAQFATVAKEAKAEQSELERLRARVAELETYGHASSDPAPVQNSQFWEQPLRKQVDEAEKRLHRVLNERDDLQRQLTIAETALDAVANLAKRVHAHKEEAGALYGAFVDISNTYVSKLEELAQEFDGTRSEVVQEQPAALEAGRADQVQRKQHQPARAVSAGHGGIGLSKPERQILTALIQHGPMNRQRIMKFAGYRPGGSVTEAFARLAREGWISNATGSDSTSTSVALCITHGGKRALGPWTPLPVGKAWRDKLKAECNKPELAFFEILEQAYPKAVSRTAILERSGYRPGGSVTEAFARLVEHGHFVSPARGLLKMSDDLFPEKLNQ